MTTRLLVPDRAERGHPDHAHERIVEHIRGVGFESQRIEPLSRRRLIRGIASSPSIDAHSTVLEPMGCVAQVPIPLLFAHAEGRRKTDSLGQLRIGEVFLLTKTLDSVVIEAAFDNTRAADHAWSLVKSGEVRCLSVNTQNERLRGLVEGIRFCDGWEIQEISICRSGANSDARFFISADYTFEW